ncbi:hypothetical protein E8E11_000424 [Didymella keratinophila]|nr:hypothetical protein E8E11_000424 [Didymella keratinophila]
MSKSSAGKHGFPVLVYLTSEPLSLSCTLRIQHHEPRKQVTLMLRTCVSLHGAGDQAFVAQYDADNLTIGGGATVRIPEDREAEIARNPTSSQMTTLSLHLNHPCPLWCPRSEALLPAPEPAHVEAFSGLVQLAKAVTLRVVFDYNWLSLDARVPYQRLVKGKERLTGFPVHEYYSRLYRLADWRAFGPTAASSPAAASNKRRLSSPLPSPPPYKRQVVEPEHAPSPTEIATSPVTVKSDDANDIQARAIAAVVQRHLPAVLADLRTRHAKQSPGVARGPCVFCGRVDKHVPGCMFQEDETDAGCVAELMERCLPDLLAEQLPATLMQTAEGKCGEQTVGEVGESVEDEMRSQLRHDENDPRSRTIYRMVQLHMPAALADALPAALKRTLPSVLPDVLPPILRNALPAILPDNLSTILPALFALPASFTSSYDSSSFDSSSTTSPPPQPPLHDYTLRPTDLTALGATLLPHLLTHLRPQLSKMHARSMARGVHYWQRTAFLELEETAEGYKGELARLTDECAEEVRDEARDVVEGLRGEVEVAAAEVQDEVCERVEEEVRRRGDVAVREAVARHGIEAGEE